MNNELATVSSSAPPRALAINSIEDASRIAKIMSSANTMPSFLKNNPADCFMVIEQAMRWNMSPFLVGQKTSLIKTGDYTNANGKYIPPQYQIMYEGQLISAAIVSSGAIQGRLKYRFDGKGDSMTCTCEGTIKGESEPRTVKLRLGDVKKKNQMWQKMPEQMLTYITARFWARRHTPDVILGVYAPDEFDASNYATVQDITPVSETPKQVQKPKPAEKKTEKPSENPTRVHQLVDKFCEKITTFKKRDDLDKWIVSEGSKNFLEGLDEKYPELSERVNKALNDHCDKIDQQEGK